MNTKLNMWLHSRRVRFCILLIILCLLLGWNIPAIVIFVLYLIPISVYYYTTPLSAWKDMMENFSDEQKLDVVMRGPPINDMSTSGFTAVHWAVGGENSCYY